MNTASERCEIAYIRSMSFLKNFNTNDWWLETIEKYLSLYRFITKEIRLTQSR